MRGELNSTLSLEHSHQPHTHATSYLRNEVAPWVHLAILILGLIANPLIIVVLSRKRIGSPATRVFLVFLAVTDVLCLMINFFLHVIPNLTKPLWFPVVTSDLFCQVGFVVNLSLLTLSPWYIVLATLERILVVYYPLRVKAYCTKRIAVILCSTMPLFWLAVYSWCYKYSEAIERTDRTTCMNGSRDQQSKYQTAGIMWLSFYFIIPAVLLTILNIAIVLRLRRVGKNHKAFITQRANQISANTSQATTTLSSIDSGKLINCASQRTPPSIISSTTTPKSEPDRFRLQAGIRKATRLVIAASLSFIILMLPRGISYAVMFSVDPKSHQFYRRNELHIIVHSSVWWLQYVNHSINFFIYVLAHKKFRFTS